MYYIVDAGIDPELICSRLWKTLCCNKLKKRHKKTKQKHQRNKHKVLVNIYEWSLLINIVHYGGILIYILSYSEELFPTC